MRCKTLRETIFKELTLCRIFWPAILHPAQSIALARRFSGLSSPEFARLLGASRSYLSFIESANRPFPEEWIKEPVLIQKCQTSLALFYETTDPSDLVLKLGNLLAVSKAIEQIIAAQPHLAAVLQDLCWDQIVKATELVEVVGNEQKRVLLSSSLLVGLVTGVVNFQDLSRRTADRPLKRMIAAKPGGFVNKKPVILARMAFFFLPSLCYVLKPSEGISLLQI
ncbi:hypothetical protein EDD75_0303 [Thermodesulfitimonas autotrophica]|uniref:Uncharacterized protein n=1 Tax=Thermodesulfitimonas autotrophica TaxID=1894989 RepID=A0A3N5AX39_9THEO|nr:helix-turn-helix domain-containing protein [Thermodesulfitimonas autotrophica]RPF49487.1 hypothetical protein EDD75_0303 [Thermodesulfitimonas autotrophica]